MAQTASQLSPDALFRKAARTNSLVHLVLTIFFIAGGEQRESLS